MNEHHLTHQEKPATVSTQPQEFTHQVPTGVIPRRAGEITGAAGLLQQAPQASQHPAIWPLVIKDMADRDNFGKEKYKQRLQGFNGRDMLMDAYQEVLDLAVYLRGALYERDRC